MREGAPMPVRRLVMSKAAARWRQMVRFGPLFSSGLAAFVGVSLASSPAQAGGKPQHSATPPNILVILADDLGYSDLGSYGSEIATPALDRLATQGVRMTHFHANPSCSPTRASLLSGADQHVAGVGAMAEAIPPHLRGRRGFEGVITERVATLGERFAAAGYRTLMSGKWHLGGAVGQRPSDRGFQNSFALMQGAANHFGQGGFGVDSDPVTRATYLKDGKVVKPGRDFYSSDAYASYLVSQLKRGSKKQPFFAYLAFTAPHSPLQAPADEIARYHGRYKDGWAQLAQRRLAAMRVKGVLPGEVVDPRNFGPSQESWEALDADKRAREARAAEVYAAMITRLDRNVGQVLDYLDRTGQRSNTIILFMSDNGAAGETIDRFSMVEGIAKRHAMADTSLAAAGSAESFMFYGPHWSEASGAPSRLYKGFLTEGGTLVPAIWSYRGLPAGGTNGVVADVRDVAATLLALANVPETDRVAGRTVASIEGTNIAPYLEAGREDRPLAMVANDFGGQASVRWGRWKLLRQPPPVSDGSWQLFDTLSDPAERRDLSKDQPDLVRDMKAAWGHYAHVHDLPSAKPN